MERRCDRHITSQKTNPTSGRIPGDQLWDEQEHGHHGQPQYDQQPLPGDYGATRVRQRVGGNNHSQQRRQGKGLQ